ncbi:GGDEF domain-containing protein [Variovorax sp. N23]|uniref:GGDEF domain-containing protein n=1 Tax=Variovorax sp. N23 TaxID=2980555 RepID=UPI0021C94D46|nr:GGDEF domain-containing protein [Variovorax sp. N23]MCU4122089.1 GGDEF domain-containing protein [Variovorax sp. N23]
MPLLSPALDPRSIIVLAGVMGLLMSIVMFSMRRSYPPSIRGLREWTLAPLASFVSTVLFALRGVLPDVFSIVLANMVLFQGCILYYAGSQLFLGHERDTRIWSVVTLVLGVVLFWFSEVQPSYPTRLAVFTLAISWLFFAHARLYLRRRAKRVGMHLMTSLLLLQSLAAGLRCLSAVLGEAGIGMLDTTWLQSLYIVMYSLTALMLSIAGVLMATDRLRLEFEFMATHDPLTGVLNRRALIERCEREVIRAQRGDGDGALALLMLDADHFKRVNDEFGHQAGDEALRQLTLRLQTPLPPAAWLGRYGGEEFVVVLPGLGHDGARAVAERLRKEAGEPFTAPSPLAATGIGRLSISIGVAVFQGPADTLDALLARADAALYRAKAQGRDRVEVA